MCNTDVDVAMVSPLKRPALELKINPVKTVEGVRGCVGVSTHDTVFKLLEEINFKKIKF